VEHRVHRRSDDACCPAWLGRWDWGRFEAPKNCSHGTAVHDRPRPVNLPIASQPVQQSEVDQSPEARLLPVTEPPPTGHSRAATQFLRQHLPRNPAAEDEQNPRDISTVWETGSTSVGLRRRGRQQGWNQIPQSIGKQRSARGPSILALSGSDGWSAGEVLLGALRTVARPYRTEDAGWRERRPIAEEASGRFLLNPGTSFLWRTGKIPGVNG
jgi:hypothetical protein